MTQHTHRSTYRPTTYTYTGTYGGVGKTKRDRKTVMDYGDDCIIAIAIIIIIIILVILSLVFSKVRQNPYDKRRPWWWWWWVEWGSSTKGRRRRIPGWVRSKSFLLLPASDRWKEGRTCGRMMMIKRESIVRPFEAGTLAAAKSCLQRTKTRCFNIMSLVNKRHSLYTYRCMYICMYLYILKIRI